MSTVIIGTLVIGSMIWAVMHKIKSMKNGDSGCGCGCSGCSKGCPSKIEKKK